MTVVESTVDTLTEYAEAVLAEAEAALATTDLGVPDIVTLTTESPAYDCCPALYVTVASIAEAQTLPNVPIEEQALRVVLGSIIKVTYIVTILRCAAPMGPNGSLPSTTALTTVAAQTQQDAWVVWCALRNAVRDGTLFERCQGVNFDPATPIREQGTCVGWEIQLRAMIPGIPG